MISPVPVRGGRIVGELDMGGAGAMALVRADQLALRALLVVEIVLDEEVAATDFVDDRGRLFDGIQIKVRMSKRFIGSIKRRMPLLPSSADANLGSL